MSLGDIPDGARPLAGAGAGVGVGVDVTPLCQHRHMTKNAPGEHHRNGLDTACFASRGNFRGRAGERQMPAIAVDLAGRRLRYEHLVAA
ncbi:MAG: hypothetical protein OXB92_00535 [Acidimicrobiaceae bacterium]|nr:hypothetical protein [Acidimicrobiaceae bacterium]